MSLIGGVVLRVSGLLACPCHLIVTVPLLISGLSGTAQGRFLSRSTGLVYTGASIYFVVALALGYWFLFGRTPPSREMNEDCPTCMPVAIDMHVPEQSSRQENRPATRR